MKHHFLLFLVVFCASGTFGQTILQYNLNKGDAFTIKQQAQQIITQELDGATHELTNTIDGVLEFKVVGKIDDNYEIALTFKDLNLLMISSIQGELMNVKAKNVAEGDMQSQVFNSLLNSPVYLVLSKTGDILEVKGGDSLVVKMTAASGLEDKFSLNIMKKSLEKEFGSEALSNNYKQMTFIYSTKEIQVGDTWKNEYFGKLNTKNTWKLEAFTDTEASISGIADIVMNVTEPATTMKLKGRQKTEITVDIATGFIKKMKVEGSSKGSSTMTQMGGQEIPTTIASIITYKLINEIHVQ
ncbi:MAG: DUF6263 family protein [Flavobacteriaceae bacterium]